MLICKNVQVQLNASFFWVMWIVSQSRELSRCWFCKNPQICCACGNDWKATVLENLLFVCYQAVDFLTIIIGVINLFWSHGSSKEVTLVATTRLRSISTYFMIYHSSWATGMNFPDVDNLSTPTDPKHCVQHRRLESLGVGKEEQPRWDRRVVGGWSGHHHWWVASSL